MIQKIRGFTLFETLVVLIITGFVTTLLLTGMGQLFDQQVRVNQIRADLRQNFLPQQWFSETVQGLTTLSRFDGEPFRGDAESFTGHSLRTLDGTIGIPIEITWRIQNNELLYETIAQEISEDTLMPTVQTQQQKYTVQKWDEQLLQFSYLDYEGNWHSQWPPATRPDAEFLVPNDDPFSIVITLIPALPRMIRLVIDEQMTWFALPGGRPIERNDLRNFM